MGNKASKSETLQTGVLKKKRSRTLNSFEIDVVDAREMISTLKDFIAFVPDNYWQKVISLGPGLKRILRAIEENDEDMQKLFDSYLIS